jgi:hypothetical protein
MLHLAIMVAFHALTCTKIIEGDWHIIHIPCIENLILAVNIGVDITASRSSRGAARNG